MQKSALFKDTNPLSPKIQFACGRYHTFLWIENILYGWGNNDYGQLGIGENKKTTARTLIDIYAKENKKISPPVLIDLSNLLLDENNRIAQISAGENHTLLLTTEGELWGCGSNYFGQLGLGDKKRENKFSKIKLPALNRDEKIIHVATGTAHTIFLTSNGNCYASGANNHGQLGLGDTELRNEFKQLNLINITNIEAGDQHTIFKDSNEHYFSCGRNQSGQLGLKNIRLGSSNTSILLPDQTTPQEFWQGDPQKNSLLAIGRNHNLLLIGADELFVWGSNLCGQLGFRKKCSMENLPTLLKLKYQIKQVAAGGNFSLLLTECGHLLVTGSNLNGELGLGDFEQRRQFVELELKKFNLKSEDKIDEIWMGADFVFAKSKMGRCFAWGNNNCIQLGLREFKNNFYEPHEIDFRFLGKEEKTSFVPSL